MEINLEIPSLVHMVMAEAGHIKDCINWGVPGKEKKLSAEDIKQGGKIVRWEVENIQSGEVMVVTANEWEEIGFDLEDSNFKETFRAVPYGFTRMFGQIFSDKPGKSDKASPDYEPHENWRCVKSDAFEEGLPVWKMFAWHFWESAAHPVSPTRCPYLFANQSQVLISFRVSSSSDTSLRSLRKTMRDTQADKERRTTCSSATRSNHTVLPFSPIRTDWTVPTSSPNTPLTLNLPLTSTQPTCLSESGRPRESTLWREAGNRGRACRIEGLKIWA